MTLALELAGPGHLVSPATRPAPAIPVVAAADAIPARPGPTLTVSLTQGCEAPLDALKAAPADHPVRCHPCDEAVVRLLLARIWRGGLQLDNFTVSAAVSPGTLRLG